MSPHHFITGGRREDKPGSVLFVAAMNHKQQKSPPSEKRIAVDERSSRNPFL
jgi:hypothetical protein